MGIRELNRKIQDFLRPKRLALGRFIWDRKKSNKKIIKNNIIENEKIKSILFIRNDGKIGDMIINTLMFREIKKSYPNIKIGVVARGANKQVIVNNPNVDKIYEYSKSTDEIKRLAKTIKDEKYDLLIDFSEMLRVKQMKFINLCKARINMGLNKQNWKLFDISVEYLEENLHITHRYKKYLKVLGLSNIDLSYDIHLSKEEEKFGKTFRGRVEEKKLICINPYGASKYRTFNKNKIKEIIDLILKKDDIGITFVFPPNNELEVKNICKSYEARVYFPEELNALGKTMSIIENSDVVITPDTSIVHISVGLEKEIIGIYRGNKGQKNQVWGPGSEKANIIYTPERDKKDRSIELGVSEFEISELKELI